MSEIEEKLRRALTELDRRVKLMASAAEKPDLRPLFAEVDALAGQLPAGSSPQLRHYLQQRSYEKARLFLEDRDAENAAGNCGRH